VAGGTRRESRRWSAIRTAARGRGGGHEDEGSSGEHRLIICFPNHHTMSLTLQRWLNSGTRKKNKHGPSLPPSKYTAGPMEARWDKYSGITELVAIPLGGALTLTLTMPHGTPAPPAPWGEVVTSGGGPPSAAGRDVTRRRERTSPARKQPTSIHPWSARRPSSTTRRYPAGSSGSWPTSGEKQAADSHGTMGLGGN